MKYRLGKALYAQCSALPIDTVHFVVKETDFLLPPTERPKHKRLAVHCTKKLPIRSIARIFSMVESWWGLRVGAT